MVRFLLELYFYAINTFVYFMKVPIYVLSTLQSKDEPPQLTSPDFKRITGKLRVIKRRKRSDAVSDSAVLSSPIESSVSKQRG